MRSIALLVLTLALGLASPRADAQTRAERLLWQGEVDAALVVAQEQADATPGDLDAQELLIDMYLSAGLAPAAVRRQTERVEQSPTDPDAHYLLGRAVVTAKEARTSYERALRFDPEHARSHMGIAAVHAAEGRQDAARDAYARAVRLDPSLSEAWLGLVRAHVALGDAAAATKAAREGVGAVPSEGGLYLALAVLQPEQARGTLAKGAKAAADDPRVHEALAGALLDDGDVKGAAEAAHRALELDPRSPDAARYGWFTGAIRAGQLDLAGYQRLVAARRLQDTDPAGALAEFDALVQRHGGTALTWLARAQLRQQQGDRDGALSDLARALKLEADNAEAQAAYGLLLLEAQRVDEARTWLARAVGARPWDRSLGLALGRAHLAAEDADAAVAELSALHRRQAWDVDVVLLLAQALVEAGQPGRAYASLGQMLGRVPDPRLAAALVMVAPAAGRHEEAARMLDQLADRGDSEQLRALAARLRAQADGG